MNRVTKRTWLMGLFILILFLGMVFFLAEYAVESGDWVSATGSPHLYNGSNLGTGVVTDRSGEVLLDMTEGRTYSENSTTRKSTLHWLGDRKGFIQAGAVSSYTAQMAGFDPVNGIYDSSGQGGEEKLTISARVQNAALEAMNGRKGVVAVYNYKTGEILCALTTPTYDPDNVPDIQDGDETYSGVYLNRFLQSAYVPGSIFKIVTTAVALETVPGIEDMTFTCTGEKSYGTESVTCEKAHGTQTLKQAFAHSCNCAFAQVAEKIGRKNMEKYVKKFGITEPISFDGVTSVAGNYDLEGAGIVSYAWSTIGQHTDLVNPARYMTFMGQIAAGGQGVEPYLVSEVRCGGEVTYTAKPKKTERILSEEIAAKVRDYMRNNVKTIYGDGNFPGLSVCAKSGTSQLGGGLKSNAMFAGFVENEEYPLAFMVVVENGGYGSATCVPVLSKVLAVCKQVMDGE